MSRSFQLDFIINNHLVVFPSVSTKSIPSRLRVTQPTDGRDSLHGTLSTLRLLLCLEMCDCFVSNWLCLYVTRILLLMVLFIQKVWHSFHKPHQKTSVQIQRPLPTPSQQSHCLNYVVVPCVCVCLYRTICRWVELFGSLCSSSLMYLFCFLIRIFSLVLDVTVSLRNSVINISHMRWEAKSGLAHRWEC